jgi:AraC-like DNA-binding protein
MLKMTIKLPPHPELAPFMEYAIAGQNHGDINAIDSFLYKDLPNARARIIFIIGRQGDVHFWIEGPRTRITVIPVNALEVIAFVVKPGALKTIIGIPVSETLDSMVDLSLVWGKEIETLKEKLFLAPDMKTRIALFEMALIKRVRDSRHRDYFVQDVANLIEKQAGFGTLEPVFQKTGYTQRQVLRKFHDWMGIGPKQFARIVRCKNLFEKINFQENPNWSFLARDHRYFDTTHLASDFTKLLGQSPSSFVEDFKQRATFLSGQSKRHVIVYSTVPETAR